MNNPNWKNLQNLILVAGHAVYIGNDSDDPVSDNNWILQDFQKGEPPFYIDHIHQGIKMADHDKKSLLLFSGGQTRLEAGHKSEAQGYWAIADHFNWWKMVNVKQRASTEEFARDSFENLLFGICRFYECTKHYPEKVTVVSWKFKKERFKLHQKAICLQDSMFNFEGVKNPLDPKDAVKGENENALEPFKIDPYGTGAKQYEIKRQDGKVKTVNLGRKRGDRNPFNRTPPYDASCPELTQLLRHKGPDNYEDSLPWKSSV